MPRFSHWQKYTELYSYSWLYWDRNSNRTQTFPGQNMAMALLSWRWLNTPHTQMTQIQQCRVSGSFGRTSFWWHHLAPWKLLQQHWSFVTDAAHSLTQALRATLFILLPQNWIHNQYATTTNSLCFVILKSGLNQEVDLQVSTILFYVEISQRQPSLSLWWGDLGLRSGFTSHGLNFITPRYAPSASCYGYYVIDRGH